MNELVKFPGLLLFGDIPHDQVDDVPGHRSVFRIGSGLYLGFKVRSYPYLEHVCLDRFSHGTSFFLAISHTTTCHLRSG